MGSRINGYRGSAKREKKRVMKTELPEDLTIEVLLRLPIKSLMRFKCVCKFWFNLVKSSDFVTMKNARTNSVGVSLFLDWYDCVKNESTTLSFRISDFSLNLSIPVRGRYIRIVGCAKGLVCLSLSNYEEDIELVVLNPATGETRQIAGYGRRDYYSNYGFCFDSTANTYKVACVTFDKIKGMNKAVLSTRTLSANSWGEERIVVLPYEEATGEYSPPKFKTCAGKCMYWQILHTGYSNILCFDMVSELFRRIGYPQFDPLPRSVVMAPYKGGIALLTSNRMIIGPYGFSSPKSYSHRAWVMEDDRGDTNQSWHKLLTTFPSAKRMRPLGFFIKDGKYSMAVSSDGELSYISENGDRRKLCETRRGEAPNFFLYAESLVSVN